MPMLDYGDQCNTNLLGGRHFHFSLNLLQNMFYEDAQDAWDLYSISPELTCTCDEFHTCQQCDAEEEKAIEEMKTKLKK